MLSLAITLPEIFISKPERVALTIAFIPIIGFVIHQLYRLSRTENILVRNRKALKYLRNLAEKEGIKFTSKKEDYIELFYIWQTTFFGDKFPKEFLYHDKRTWHYIHSFWSICFASILGIIIIIGLKGYNNVSSIIFLIFFKIIFIIFLLKGIYSYSDINKKEEYFTRQYKGLFIETIEEQKKYFKKEDEGQGT